MKSAHYHGDAAPAVFRGNLIGALGRIRFHTHRHQVRWLVERDALRAIVVKTNLCVGVARGQTGQSGRSQRFHLPGADVRLASPAADAGMDERYSHRMTSSIGSQLPVAVIKSVEMIGVKAIAEIGGDG